MRSAEKRNKTEEKVLGTKIDVSCGWEDATFDISLFGPGGSSRCIKFGEHLITPIEFEALAGKKTKSWKTNIRFEGKPLKALFDSNFIKPCEKACACDNCEIGRQHPSDLPLLIEKVYLNKPYDLSIVKIEKEDKETTPKKNIADQISNNEEEDKLSIDNTDILSPKADTIISDKETNGKELSPVDGVAPLNDVKDEFCSSPDPSPRKKRSSIETPVDEILEGKEAEEMSGPERTAHASEEVE